MGVIVRLGEMPDGHLVIWFGGGERFCTPDMKMCTHAIPSDRDLPLPTSHHGLARALRLQLRASWDIPELVL